jgi:serine/threonine-protein kinase RsbW
MMPSASHTYCFANEALSVGLARTTIAGLLAEWGLDGDVIEKAVIFTSEFAANAVRHASESLAFVLTSSIKDGHLTVSVMDFAAGLPEKRDPAPHDVCGRGLVLVDSVADEWGYVPFTVGKMVFACLKTEPEIAADDDPSVGCELLTSGMFGVA